MDITGNFEFHSHEEVKKNLISKYLANLESDIKWH